MDLKNIYWNEQAYKEFIQYLNSLQDIKYHDFHKKLILKDNLIGIKTPVLKEIAKCISKTDYHKFIELNTHQIYEEGIIHGLILGYIKVDWEEFIILFNNFIKYIDNWATCDLLCSNNKQFKKNQEKGLIEIKKYLKSNNLWEIRVGLVTLLASYINDNYIDTVLALSNEVVNEEYYVKMANAWLISICYIKYPQRTNEFLKTTKIDNWTYNKAIQKIRESNRIDKETKNRLNLLKRKRS